MYDLAGKRTSMQWLLGTNGYGYNDFGALSTVTDPNSNQYGIRYTLAGQVDSLLLGTGVTEDRNYDGDGRMTFRNRVSSYGSLGTLGTNTFVYDRMNRVIHAAEQNYQQLASETRISYDGLGAVLASEQSNSFGSNVEEFRNDPLGNVLYRRTRRTAGGNDAPFTFQYSPNGELMTSFSHLGNPPGQGQLGDTLEQSFASEQLIREDRMERNPNDGSISLQLATRHYYGADDKLMAVQRYSWRGPPLSDGTWEEYWYDALGRRVLTRARRDPSSIYDAFISGPLCMGGIHCRSFTERVWWDGDQALIEERTPEGTSDVSNSGLVGNIHGLTLDEPLAVMTDQVRIVNYNWRGLGQSSVFPNGQAGDASLGNSATEIDWPALTQAQTYFTPGPGSGGGSNPKRWMGTFVANGQGTTGMLYRRNRYFSPTSGQFTQSDPIGIAGGMNAFGFANGDPINFSDPFGLCPPCAGLEIGVGVLGVEGFRKYRFEQWVNRASEQVVPLVMGFSTPMAVVGGSSGTAIGRIIAGFSERFGRPIAEAVENGVSRLEFNMNAKGTKIVVRGPETHPLPTGGKPVRHYNVEVHEPTRSPGRFKKVENTHIDEKGRVINP